MGVLQVFEEALSYYQFDLVEPDLSHKMNGTGWEAFHALPYSLGSVGIHGITTRCETRIELWRDLVVSLVQPREMLHGLAPKHACGCQQQLISCGCSSPAASVSGQQPAETILKIRKKAGSSFLEKLWSIILIRLKLRYVKIDPSRSEGGGRPKHLEC